MKNFDNSVNEDVNEDEDFDEDEFKQEEGKLYMGIIRGFQGSFMSGLATLVIEDEKGLMNYIYCDNGQTVRSLEDAFGNVIGNSHNVRENGGHIGKKIFYVVDSLNVMEWFVPYDEAPLEMINDYKRQNGQMTLPDFAM